jgi:hypothetical protein
MQRPIDFAITTPQGSIPRRQLMRTSNDDRPIHFQPMWGDSSFDTGLISDANTFSRHSLQLLVQGLLRSSTAKQAANIELVPSGKRPCIHVCASNDFTINLQH